MSVEPARWPESWRVWDETHTRYCYIQRHTSNPWYAPDLHPEAWKIWSRRPYEPSTYINADLIDAFAAALVWVNEKEPEG